MGPAGLMDSWEWSEAFADRRYQPDQRLVPRSEPGAVLNEAETLAQVRRLITKEEVTTIDGTPLSLSATTLCVHGDNPVGVSLIRAIREMLDEG